MILWLNQLINSPHIIKNQCLEELTHYDKRISYEFYSPHRRHVYILYRRDGLHWTLCI